MHSSKTALQSRMDKGLAASSSTHSALLGAATHHLLRSAQRLHNSLTSTINLPSEGVEVALLLENVMASLPQWQSCYKGLDSYCDTLLSHGVYIDTETHMAMARIAHFLADLPGVIESLEESSKRAASLMHSQISTIATWLSGVT
ncbi:hypothetical protein KIPB_011423, partial [Kipferlia bialata]|eukprot:g11423.t1